MLLSLLLPPTFSHITLNKYIDVLQMLKRRRTLGGRDSQVPSPDGSEDDEAKSPAEDDSDCERDEKSPEGSMKRGRSVRERTKQVEDFVRDEFKRDPMDLLH